MILGIDPGKSGGIAWVSPDNALIYKMPETERDVWELLRSFAPNTRKAYLEKVHSMPNQGVSSTFKFGTSYGMLWGFLVALEVPFEFVTPQKWQKAMGCLSKGDKNVTKRRAQELYPNERLTHATADAALIATYGLREWMARATL